MKNQLKITRLAIMAFGIACVSACVSQEPTMTDIEGLILKQTMAGFVKYTEAKVTSLNCAESDKKFSCEFNARVKGVNIGLTGTEYPFETDVKNAKMKVIRGGSGWMQVAS